VSTPHPKLRIALAVAVLVGWRAEAHAAPPMLPGAWRQTVVFELLDNETRALKRISENTTISCFTAARLARPPLSPEKVTESGGKCEQANREIKPDGSDVWQMTCQTLSGTKYRSVFERFHTASRMRGVLHSITEYRGEVVEGRVTTEGERIGECTPEMPIF